MKPASEYEIRYGHGILEEDSSLWPPYVAVSTPTAWKTAKGYLSKKPEGVAFNQWLDRNHLEETADSLPDNAEIVVGVGGGRALDHAKFVAVSKNIPLIQVPTVVSTGAIIHGFCGDWTGRVMHGHAAVKDAEYVLVDYDLVLEAPERLNTAGLGDILCGYAGISEWRYNSARDEGPPFDDESVAGALNFYEEIVERFPKTIGQNGNLSDASVKFIMKAVQSRDDRGLKNHPAAPSADHSFCFAVELANDKFWTHGESCALAAVIVAWHTGQQPELLVTKLDTCRIRFRPLDMNMTREQLRLGLEQLPYWMGDREHGRDVNSIMRNNPVVGTRFDEAWDWLNQV